MKHSLKFSECFIEAECPVGTSGKLALSLCIVAMPFGDKKHPILFATAFFIATYLVFAATTEEARSTYSFQYSFVARSTLQEDTAITASAIAVADPTKNSGLSISRMPWSYHFRRSRQNQSQTDHRCSLSCLFSICPLLAQPNFRRTEVCGADPDRTRGRQT